LAPQFFKVSAIGHVSGDGHLAARLEATYDLLITQRLILQPQLELNFYTKDDPARRIGPGCRNSMQGCAFATRSRDSSRPTSASRT
jgi:copper resistance protein B